VNTECNHVYFLCQIFVALENFVHDESYVILNFEVYADFDPF